MLILEDPFCKVAVGFDPQLGYFNLTVDDRTFLELPFKASVDPLGPMNIKCGAIFLNDVLLNPEENYNWGFTEYDQNAL